MNDNTLSVGMLGLMLLTKDQHGDLEFCKFKDSRYGKRIQRETLEELACKLQKRTNNDTSNIDGISIDYFKRLAGTEARNIKQYTERYTSRLKDEGLYQMLDDGTLRLWSEINQLLESYLRLYTYYDLAYGEGILLSEMKGMVEDIRGEIF